jgi:hypothetical protein
MFKFHFVQFLPNVMSIVAAPIIIFWVSEKIVLNMSD